MDVLLTIKDQDFISDAAEVDRSNYENREAARAVLVGSSGQIYLMHVGLHGYHKLPGGGVDVGEDLAAALERELMEEVGCAAEVILKLGEIIEYRDSDTLKQVSHCFLARQVGKQAPSALEEGELAEEMTEVIAQDIDEAVSLLENDAPDNIEGKFIQKRDLAFLRAARSLLPDTIE